MDKRTAHHQMPLIRVDPDAVGDGVLIRQSHQSTRRMLPRLVSPSFISHLLQRLHHARVVQQRLTS